MLATELDDHRRSPEPTLLDALRAHNPLALAETYHRTAPAAYACARRLLASPAQIEALLRRVYLELWEDPPKDVPLEGWIRGQCFALAAADLRGRRAAPASPSAAILLPDLPAPDVRYLDAVERILSELGARARTVLLLAHDCGVSTAAQGGDAAEALDCALLALAGPETSSADAAALRSDPCPEGVWMGDWVLGLLEPSVAQEFEALAASRPGCAARARALRRGRRRLEGLPPTPDMGQRILVTVVSAARLPAFQASEPEPEPEPQDDEDHGQWLPNQSWPPLADTPSDAPTGEFALDDLRECAPAENGNRGRPHDGHVTITEPVTAVSVAMPDSDDDTAGIRARRPNPYSQLVDLESSEEDFELPDPHRVGPRASATVEPDSEEFELPEEFASFYPEEELLTRPSAGQRVLVVIGYVLPVLLGAGLGLYLADLLFTR